MRTLVLLFALLAPLGAAAQDTGAAGLPAGLEGLEDAPSLAEGITKVPSGSYLVLVEDDKVTVHWVPGKQWLLPDSYYTEAIVQAKQLKICQPALELGLALRASEADRVGGVCHASQSETGVQLQCLAESLRSPRVGDVLAVMNAGPEQLDRLGRAGRELELRDLGLLGLDCRRRETARCDAPGEEQGESGDKPSHGYNPSYR